MTNFVDERVLQARRKIAEEFILEDIVCRFH